MVRVRLGVAILEAIGGPGAARPISTGIGAMNALRAAYGSDRAAARAMDVPASTWRGWRKGRTPALGFDWLIETAEQDDRRERLSDELEAELRQPFSTEPLRVRATFNYNAGGSMKGAENRNLPLGGYLNDVGSDLVDAYLAGADADELEAILVDAIADRGFYAQTFSSPEGMWDIHRLEGWGQ